MPMAVEKDRSGRLDSSSSEAEASNQEADQASRKPRSARKDGPGERRSQHHKRGADSPREKNSKRSSKYHSEHREEREAQRRDRQQHESRQRSRSRDRESDSRRYDKDSQDDGRSHRDRRERDDRSPHEREKRAKETQPRGHREKDPSSTSSRGRNKDSSYKDMNYGLRQNSKREDSDSKIKQEPQTDTEPDRQERKRRQRDRERDPQRSNIFRDDGTAEMAYGKPKEEEDDEDEPPPPKIKANFGLSGKLAEETNVCNGVVVKYSEPPEARRPKRRWRFYVFKGDEPLPTLYLHRQSAFLMGRDRKVADMPIDHPSCSKQHAVLQFRLVNYERPDGSSGRTVRPYIIDLGSSNGTFLNNQKVEAKRYVQLFEKDVLKFGFSSREYVLLHEDSKDEAEQDDLGAEAGAAVGDE